MATSFKGPSGKIYRWEKDTPPTDADIAALVEADRLYVQQQGGGAQAAQPTEAPEDAVRSERIATQAKIAGGGGAMAPSGMMPMGVGPEFGGQKSMEPVAREMLAAGAEGGLTSIGQAAGAPLGPVGVAGVGFLGGAGGRIVGDIIRGETPTVEKALGSGVSGMVPGAGLRGLSKARLAFEAGKQAGANVAGMAAEDIASGKALDPEKAAMYAGMSVLSTAVGKVLDPGQIVDRETQRKIQDSLNQQNLERLKAEGIKILPSMVNTNKINALIETLAGRSATVAEIRDLNNELFTTLSQRAIGLDPKLGPLTQDRLEKAVVEAAQPYAEIRALRTKAQADLDALEKTTLTAQNAHELAIVRSDPKMVEKMAELGKKAAADVDAFREADRTAKTYSKKFEVTFDPEDQKLAEKFRNIAEERRISLRDGLNEMGKPELYKEFEKARVRIAKIGEVENALLPTGYVDPQALARSSKAGTKFTGELEAIARFASDPRFKPVATSEVKMRPEVGRFQAGLEAIGAPLNALVKSDIYQQMMARPSYTDMPDFIARFARTATQSELERLQSEPNSVLQFYQGAYPRQEQQQQQGTPINRSMLNPMQFLNR
jgi:hypothetical protein